MDLYLAGKTALVTGASISGCGRAIAATLARENSPVGRFGHLEALADVVTFLASPRTNTMTGTVIPVDGGIKRYAHLYCN